MKKILFVVVGFLLMPGNVYPQQKTLLVSYLRIPGLGSARKFDLFINDTLSYWHRVKYDGKIRDTIIKTKLFGHEYKMNPSQVITVSDPEYETYPYKNFILKDKKRDTLFYVVHRYNRPDMYVTDTLFPMKWEILSEHKTVLGYPCTAARTHFRGRTYKAWFTPEIPVSDGPWKFGGLPGLILEVEEEYYHFIATNIVFNPGEKPKLPPLDKYKFIPWAEYVKIMRDFYDRKIKERIARKIREGDKFNSGMKLFDEEIIHPIYSKNGVFIPGVEALKKQKKTKPKKKKRKRFLGIF